MGKTYLFSPVGNTDPIKYFHDGSMLHICRHYKPDEVYLYLSKEMAENERKDERYTEAIKLLGEKLNHTFEIHIEKDEDMVNVQQYDIFYEKFRKIIEKIENEKEEEDILLLNMASGTPAMKSALLVMATLAEYRFLPIQVSTPKEKSNLEYEERECYDGITNWELNADNENGAENRCQEVRCLNLMKLLKLDIIKKHLLSYDYQAALEVGKDIQKDLNPISYRWLEAAAARSTLDLEKMNKFLPEGNGVVTSVKNDNRRRILFEYTLVIDLKVKRGEYADFVRAITPLGVELLELILQQYCDIDITRYYTKADFRKWSEYKMENTEILELAKGEYSTFKYGPVYSTQLNNIIQKKCKDSLIAQRVQEFVNIEKNVRNIAAHNVVSVKNEWIKEKTGKTIQEIMWMIKYLCEKVKINTKKEQWDSYDLMNAAIVESLQK